MEGGGEQRIKRKGRGAKEGGGLRREEGKEGGTTKRMGGSRAQYSPPLRAGPGSAGRRAPCAGSIAPGPWSCAAWFRVADTWWDTCPGYPPGRAGPSQPPAPPSLDHPPPPGSNLTSSTVWGLRVPGRPCRRLSTARFTFSVQRGSGWPGHRRATRPACRTKRSGTRPRAALRGDQASGGGGPRSQATSSAIGPEHP